MKQNYNIKIINENKTNFLDLLLLGDEDLNMINKYINRGKLFALYNNKNHNSLKSICLITQEDKDIFEIQNLATYKKDQNHGYAKALLDFIFDYYKNTANKKQFIYVGTGDNSPALDFYKKYGFVFSHRIANYFIANYPNPIFENGRQLKDKVYYFKKI